MEDILFFQQFATPLGPMIACADEKGICLLEFYEAQDFEARLLAIQKIVKGTLVNKENRHLQQAVRELQEYFKGERKTFDVALHPLGTDFQKQVWQALLTIPYGSRRSYMQQTLSFTGPESIRAVANANGKNRIAIIIPCHRVIGANGQLTGYAGGLWRKKFLLELESKMKQAQFL